MKRNNILFILGFIFLLAGILSIVARYYNYLEISKILTFILLALGTFLIIIEVILYHQSLEK